jgi:hypothetical protein
MDRRSFIKILAAACGSGALPMAAYDAIADDLPVEIPARLPPPQVIVTHRRVMLISDFSAFGTETDMDRPRFAVLDLCRTDDKYPLLTISLNVCGGIARFVPAMGCEPIFIDSAIPLVFCDDPMIDWNIVMRELGGSGARIIGQKGGDSFAYEFEMPKVESREPLEDEDEES